MQHQIAQYQNSATSHSAILNKATLTNLISNSETLYQCNIKYCNNKTVHHLIVQYYSTMLNSATLTITIATSATATSTI